MVRTKKQERLDVEVATTLFGFRWVQWNERALGGSPLYAPGRFLAPPDDATAHLYEDAPETSPLHENALAKVPEYSGDEWCAFMVADRVGLFAEGHAVLSREEGGEWAIDVRGLQLRARQLPALLCRAALQWRAAASSGRR